jgi:hypothetical protein
MADTLRTALREARAKLEKLFAERKKIDNQILEWKRVVDSLTAVSEEVSDKLPPDVEMEIHTEKVGPQWWVGNPPQKVSRSFRLKFTDAVREILRLWGTNVIGVPEIRDRLEGFGFDFSKYKQQLVPVHNTLKRLEEQGEVRTVKDKRGRLIGYQWIEPIERAMRDEGLTDVTRKILDTMRATTPKVAARKGKVKTDDTASTKTE